MSNETATPETNSDLAGRAMSELLGCVLPCKTHTKVGDEMTWPSYNNAVGDVGWKLRYAPDTLTRGDQLVAASVISAYFPDDWRHTEEAECRV